ncbi:conserved hypothetical protein [delta proteobacterium NaphS2]|nr:conserved hypothetical protein [delta proteobacterium NaphS2]
MDSIDCSPFYFNEASFYDNVATFVNGLWPEKTVDFTG